MKRFYSIIALCIVLLIAGSGVADAQRKKKGTATANKPANPMLTSALWWQDPSSTGDGGQLCLKISADGTLVLSEVYDEYLIMTHGKWKSSKSNEISFSIDFPKTTAKIRDAVEERLSAEQKTELQSQMTQLYKTMKDYGTQDFSFGINKLDTCVLMMSGHGKSFCFCSRYEYNKRKKDADIRKSAVEAKIDQEFANLKKSFNRYDYNSDFYMRFSVDRAARHTVLGSFDKVSKNIVSMELDGKSIPISGTINVGTPGTHYLMIKTKKMTNIPESVFMNLNGHIENGMPTVKLQSLAVPRCIKKISQWNTAGCAYCSSIYLFASMPQVTATTFCITEQGKYPAGYAVNSRTLYTVDDVTIYNKPEWTNALFRFGWNISTQSLEDLGSLFNEMVFARNELHSKFSSSDAAFDNFLTIIKKFPFRFELLH